MRKFLFTFALLYAFLFSNSIYSQGFNSITTPDGVNIIAVGNSGKFYRSANAGSSYISTTVSGTPNLNCVTSLGNDVWFCGVNGNVYKTTATVSSNSIYNVGSSITLNSIFFIDANTGFVCGDNGYVYKSINGGVNWTLSNSGITGGKLNSINFGDASNGTIVANNGYTYVTSNGGASWSYQASGTGFNLLKVKYFNDSLVAVGESGTLLLNKNGSWNSVATRIRSDIRGVSGTSMSNVHVCGGGGFIRNNKNGNALFTNFEKNPMMANLTDIFFYDGNKGWAVSSLNGVIIYTTDGGTSWSMPAGSSVSFNWVSKPGASGSFLGNNICQNPADKNSYFVCFSAQVYVSRDKGETYSAVGTPIPSGSTPHSFFVSPLDTNIWIVATESSPDKVFRTTNYGASWSTPVMALNFSNYGQPLEIDQNNPNVFYFAPDNGGFYKSTNSGASFTEISGNYPFRSPCEILVTWDSSNIIILGDGVTGSGRAKMFKSTNGGVNWSAIDSTASSETPSMCNSVFDKGLVWCTEWSGSNIYKSTNYGSSYVVSHSTGFSGWGSDVCREDPTMVITGGWGASATLSTNSGQTWTGISSGLSGHGGGILIAERGIVIAQQGTNVYKLNIQYTDTPVQNNIDVQALSIGGTGSLYYPTPTINPQGIVKNNNGGSSASFSVTRKISPGGYQSTISVINLAANSSTTVTFAPWTFSAGTVYTVKDSVYLADDINPANDVLSGTITPYLGETTTRVNEGFTGSYPPANWTFQFSGNNYWIYNAVSSYGVGTGSSEYNYWNSSSGTIQSLFTPTFASPSIAGDSLSYDYAYAPYTSGTDSLIIETSTNGGSSYSTLVRLRGRASDTIGANLSLKTAATSSSEFTPSSSQWLSKKWNLPVGTNKIKFRARSGFGNNLYLDSIRVSTNKVYTQVNLKLTPEGLYNGSTKNLEDTIKVYLRNISSPFAAIDSATAVIDDATLDAACVFKNASSGTYYFQVLHRNSIETWSKSGGESMTRGVTLNYDFTSAQSQSYGSNSIFVVNKYCFYSGDVNQDGAIEGTDLSIIDNDAFNFENGYIVTDLNGDGIVDGSDLLIADNNASNFIVKNTPEVSTSDFQFTKDKIKQSLEIYRNKKSELK